MKKYIKQAVALVVTAVVACTFTIENTVNVEAAKSLSQLQKERNSLAQKTKNAKAQLEAIKNKKASMQEEIDAVDGMLNAVQEELNKAEKDLLEVNGRLAESEIALAEATEAKENQFNLFGKRIKFFYEEGDIGYLDIIFEAENFSDMLTRAQYVEDIMEYDNKILENLKETQKTIEEKTEQIKEEKKTAEDLVVVQENKKNEVLAIMEEKQTIMASYKQDESKYQQMIAENEKASQEVERLINAAASSGSSPATVYTGGRLNWPVPARAASSSSLSSGFINRMSPVGRGWEKHTGYDIPAPYGSSIVAAEAGTVIYSGWMRGYGNTIMVDHGGGLVTLYGHNSSLVVSKGQQVSRGQQVAKCGSTGYSTGNHCHFEVRSGGKAVSPESYLGVPNVGY